MALPRNADGGQEFSVQMVTAAYHYERVNELLAAKQNAVEANRKLCRKLEEKDRQIAALNQALAEARFPIIASTEIKAQLHEQVSAGFSRDFEKSALQGQTDSVGSVNLHRGEGR